MILPFISAIISENTNSTSACDAGWAEVPSYGCYLFSLDEGMNWLDAQVPNDQILYI